MVSFLTNKITLGILSFDQGRRSKNIGHVVFVSKVETGRDSLCFFVEIQELGFMVFQKNISGSNIPFLAENFHKNIVELIQFLRITAILQWNVVVLQGSAQTHFIGEFSRDLQIEIGVQNRILVVADSHPTRDASRSVEPFKRSVFFLETFSFHFVQTSCGRFVTHHFAVVINAVFLGQEIGEFLVVNRQRIIG